MRNIGIVLTFIAFAFTAHAQVILSNSSPKIKWRSIENDRFNLIYSEEFSNSASHIASLLDTLYFVGSKTMHSGQPKKISVILRDRSALSNGFVALGPKRSEIFTMPSQNYNFIGTNDWLEKVVIHEYRHVVQFDHSNVGFNKFIHYLLGDNSFSLLSFVAAPQWYWEGDAVASETLLTKSGRGRIPAFTSVFRANLLEGNRYNYNKQFLRSYKDNIPNHYVLGNFLIPYLRDVSGDAEIWEKITHNTFKLPVVPFRFSTSMRKFTGKNLTQTYESMMDELTANWKEEQEKIQLTSLDTLKHKESKVYTDYLYPQPMSDGSVLVQKEGLADIQKFVKVNADGSEKKIFTPGIVNRTAMLSHRDNKIAWTEYNYHPRWRNESYSVIKIYDLEDKALSRLVYRSRYSGADIDGEGLRIVTTETTEDYRHSIIVLGMDGTVIKKIPNPQNVFYSNVRFLNKDELVATVTTSKGKSLTILDIESGETEDIISAGQENIGHPTNFGDLIFYGSDYSGIDNIYAIDRSTGQNYQVTSTKYGAYSAMPDADGKFLYFTVQTAKGKEIAKIAIDPTSWTKKEEAIVFHNALYDKSIEQEGNSELLENLVEKEFESKPYKKTRGLLNPHSWGPFVSNSIDEVDFGIFSRDPLSTLSLYGGYSYDLNQEIGKYVGRISYQGIHPIIDLEGTSGNRVANSFLPDTTGGFKEFQYKWKEEEMKVGVRLPYILTNSKYLTSLTLSSEYSLTNISGFQNSIDGVGRTITFQGNNYYLLGVPDNGILDAISLDMSLFNYLKRSKRDIQPRFGQHLIAGYKGNVNKDWESGRFIARTGAFFPGLAKHHSLNGYWEYQWMNITRESDNYVFSGGVRVPRGTSPGLFQNFYSMGVNYELPLLYPDLSIGPFLYIQRIRFNGFYHYAFGQSDFGENGMIKRAYQSVGGELRFDFNAGRILSEITMGVRYAYDINTGAGELTLIFPTIDL